MADSSATTLSLHSDEGYNRSVVPSTQDAIPIFTRLDIFDSATPRKTDGSPSWGKGKEQSLLLHSAVQLVRPSETQGQQEREAEQSMRNTGALQTGSTEPILNSCFPLAEAKPFAGQQPQCGNCHTASKHFQRPSDTYRKTAQLKSQHPFIPARLKASPESSQRQLTATATGFTWQHFKTILLRSPSDLPTQLPGSHAS